jgi:hypothetical protein
MADTRKLEELTDFLTLQAELSRGSASESCQEIKSFIDSSQEPFSRYTLDESNPYFKQVKKKKCGCF